MSKLEKKILLHMNHMLADPYALLTLWYVSGQGKATYVDIRTFIVYVTNTELTNSLHILVDNGLLRYDGKHYTLTKLGNELIPLLKDMVEWGKKHV